VGLLTRVRVGNFKLKVNIQEIHLEWREALETILLIFLSMILYMSVVFTQFSFIPIIFITIKRGWKETLVYLTVAAIFFIYMIINDICKFPLDSSILLFSPTHYIFNYIGDSIGFEVGRFLDYYFLYGTLGISLGFLISKNYNLSHVVFVGLSVYLGMVIFLFVLTGFFGGLKDIISNYYRFVENKIDNFVDFYLLQIVNYKGLSSSTNIDYSLLEKKIRLSARIFKEIIIFGIAPRGGYLIREITLIFVSVVFTNLYFKKKLDKAAFKFNIKNYYVDDNLVWGLIISWGIVYINLYIKNNFITILSWNMAVVFSLLYFLKGLSIIKIGADRIKIPTFFQYAVLLFFLIYSFIIFVAIVTGIGTADIWLKMQENLKKKEEEQ